MDDLIASLHAAASHFEVEVGAPIGHSGIGNEIRLATRPDGSQAVLKVHAPFTDEYETGVEALTIWDGRGAVRLLAHHDPSRAMLLELAQPGETLYGAPFDAAVDTALAVMRRLHVGVPDGCTLRPLDSYLHAFTRHREMFGGAGPLPADLFERGEQVYGELLATAEARTVLHGDLNYGNVLTARRSGHLAIDPKGLTGDPAFEPGILIRDRFDDITSTSDPIGTLKELMAVFGAALEQDPQRLGRWGFAQAVLAAGVWNCEDGPPYPTKIQSADLWTAAGYAI